MTGNAGFVVARNCCLIAIRTGNYHKLLRNFYFAGSLKSLIILLGSNPLKSKPKKNNGKETIAALPWMRIFKITNQEY